MQEIEDFKKQMHEKNIQARIRIPFDLSVCLENNWGKAFYRDAPVTILGSKLWPDSDGGFFSNVLGYEGHDPPYGKTITTYHMDGMSNISSNWRLEYLLEEHHDALRHIPAQAYNILVRLLEKYPSLLLKVTNLPNGNGNYIDI